MDMYNPCHPGEILLEEWIKPLNYSISKFAIMLGTSRKNLSEIVNEKTGVSPEMALKLAKALNTSPDIWLKMQMQYDLWQAKQRVNLDSVRVIAN